jgi:hypothetical protein
MVTRYTFSFDQGFHHFRRQRSRTEVEGASKKIILNGGLN